jgi:hypothetical protein
MEQKFELVMQRGPSVERRYLLDRPEMVIGRDVANQIPINDSEISRQHVKLTRQAEGYIIQDLGSTNGTFVNEVRLSGLMRLEHGVQIRMGDNVILVFEVSYDSEATMASTPERMPIGAPTAPAPPRAQAAPSPPPPGQQYAGRVPASPPPVKEGGMNWRMIGIGCGVLLILFSCVVIAALFYIDANNLWCDWLGWLFTNRCVL